MHLVPNNRYAQPQFGERPVNPLMLGLHRLLFSDSYRD